MTSDELERVLAVEGAALLVQVLDRLPPGPVAEEPQDASRATYAAKITRADAPMDWRRPARAMHDQVRGLHPWPHATLVCDGRRVIVHRSIVPAVAAPVRARHRHRRRPRRASTSPRRRPGAAPAGPAARRRPTAARPRRSRPAAWSAPRRSVRDAVIAPARRAAFDALVELAGGRRDLADVARRRAAAARRSARRRAAPRARRRHGALAVAARRRHRAAVAGAAGRSWTATCCSRSAGRLPAAVPGSRAAVGGGQRRRGAGPHGAQEVQRRRSGQRGAAPRWRPARAGTCRPRPDRPGGGGARRVGRAPRRRPRPSAVARGRDGSRASRSRSSRLARLQQRRARGRRCG